MGTWFCAVFKFGNHTCTRVTHFGSTVGYTETMAKPICVPVRDMHSRYSCSYILSFTKLGISVMSTLSPYAPKLVISCLSHASWQNDLCSWTITPSFYRWPRMHSHTLVLTGIGTHYNNTQHCYCQFTGQHYLTGMANSMIILTRLLEFHRDH